MFSLGDRVGGAAGSTARETASRTFRRLLDW